MTLRTRLIIAFLLLSVLPLTAVTLLSYRSSVAAFERAAEQEATESAVDVTRRMDIITADVGRRVDRVFETAPRGGGEDIYQHAAPVLGEAAALLERVEFHPAEAPDEPAPASTTATASKPAPLAPFGPPPPPSAPSPRVIVMDVPKIMAEVRREMKQEMGDLNPALTSLIEQSMVAAATGVEIGLKVAGEAIANKAESAAAQRARSREMDVDGRRLAVDVRKDGKLVGKANAVLNMDRTMHAVLAFAQRDRGEIPFAIDKDGKLYTPKAEDLSQLKALDVERLASTAADGPPERTDDWIVVARRDAGGSIFGIARPLGDSLREIRRASVRNLGLGLGVIALAVIGIVPISHRMTQHLRSLTAGVRQLSSGDFTTRVPVRSSDEFGTLAASFNQMAADLERHQALVVEQERLRGELELSRQIQTEMLPRAPLRSSRAEIAGVSVPAREVGGDFFNYFDLSDGRLALLVGDVSGKGVSAALLMANAQATLRARLPVENDLAALADAFDRELDLNTPRSVYLTLFMGILEKDGRTLRYVNAGHNPQFLIRGDGRIQPLSSTGLPIALFAGHGYSEASVSLEQGDLLFFYTDGLVEAENAAGDMFGAERLQQLLADTQSRDIDAILRHVEENVRAFRGSVEPLDDATMMALRVI
ncbi:MAG TPA: SpoIIE family protein phosphatase [Vicinamibacterales bacterium]